MNILRLVLVVAGLAAGIALWKLNEHLPQKNRAAANTLIEMRLQEDALESIAMDLKKYGVNHPAYRRVLEKHRIDDLLQPMDESK